MSQNPSDTICAISTAPGVGGIAVIRISGPEAFTLTDKLWRGKRLSEASSHTAHLGRIIDPESGETLDEAVATVFRAPASFTGENVVELSVHGSIWIQRQLINLLIAAGCRLAEAGEFTRRAFAVGKLDLAEAEAVADVIASTSRASHRVAMSQMRGQFSRRLAELREKLLELASLLELELDFSEEHVEFADRGKLLALSQETHDEVSRLAASFATGDAIRRGIPVAIVGRPNVGKSSILNILTGDNRAIVSDIPGTTRDTIEDTVDINGYTFRFIDTAGLRRTSDTVENLGIERAWQKVGLASIILWVIDPEDLGMGKGSLSAPFPNDTDAEYIVDNDSASQTRQCTNEKLQIIAKQIANARQPDSRLILILNKSDLLPTATSTTQIALSNHSVTSAISSGDLQSDADKSSATPISEPADTLGLGIAFDGFIILSAHTGAGVDQLRAQLTEAVATDTASPDDVIVSNARHYEALTAAAASLDRVIAGLSTTLSADFIAQDVRETIHHLSAITGAITTPDILTTIFSRFCIGK